MQSSVFPSPPFPILPSVVQPSGRAVQHHCSDCTRAITVPNTSCSSASLSSKYSLSLLSPSFLLLLSSPSAPAAGWKGASLGIHPHPRCSRFWQQPRVSRLLPGLWLRLCCEASLCWLRGSSLRVLFWLSRGAQLCCGRRGPTVARH